MIVDLNNFLDCSGLLQLGNRLFLPSMRDEYLDSKNDGVSADDADGTHAPLDSFNGILDLEEMSVGGEDCDG